MDSKRQNKKDKRFEFNHNLIYKNTISYMNFFLLIGYIGCACLCISFVPQTYIQILNRNQEGVKDLSFSFIGLILFASLCMSVYAYHMKTYPILIANTSVCLNNVIILGLQVYKKFYVHTINANETSGILV